MPATNKAFTTEDTESTEEYPIVFLSDLRVLGNCSCVALPPVTHMDVGNAKAMLEHRWPSMQSSDVVLTKLVPPRYGDSSGVRGAAWL